MLNIQCLLESLQTQGWYYQTNVLDETTLKSLQQLCKTRVMKTAGIGQHKMINTEIRSDMISWLETNEEHPAILDYFAMLERLKNQLNESFYIGLKGHEAHFARYEKGCFYKKHKDSFSKQNKRAVTFILYLNENWTLNDGGELRLYMGDEYRDIHPTAGSIICFMSDEIEHEVRLSHNTRHSLTAWLLR